MFPEAFSFSRLPPDRSLQRNVQQERNREEKSQLVRLHKFACEEHLSAKRFLVVGSSYTIYLLSNHLRSKKQGEG